MYTMIGLKHPNCRFFHPIIPVLLLPGGNRKMENEFDSFVVGEPFERESKTG